MKFKKQWAPSDDVRVRRVERAGLDGWTVSGSLKLRYDNPKKACTDAPYRTVTPHMDEEARQIVRDLKHT